jgi:hypothetical protein
MYPLSRNVNIIFFNLLAIIYYEKKVWTLMVDKSIYINKAIDHLSPQLIELRKYYDLWLEFQIEPVNGQLLIFGSPWMKKNLHRFPVWHVQYSQRHTCSLINHCDRHITLLSDTDTFVYCLNAIWSLKMILVN